MGASSHREQEQLIRLFGQSDDLVGALGVLGRVNQAGQGLTRLERVFQLARCGHLVEADLVVNDEPEALTRRDELQTFRRSLNSWDVCLILDFSILDRDNNELFVGGQDQLEPT